MKNMKPNVDFLHSVWNSSKESTRKKELALEELNLDELTNALFSNGPFYYFVVNFSDMKINYMSPSVKEIHGFNPEYVMFQDILNETHPDDLSFVAKAESAAWDVVFKRIGRTVNKKYKISYCLRLKTIDGSYQLFHHQCIILTTDEAGNVCKTLNIHTNINHLTTQNNYKVSAIGMFGEPSYMDIPLINILPSKQILFSKRETKFYSFLPKD